MSDHPLLETLTSDALPPPPNPNPNPRPSTSSSPALHPWEEAARAWLTTLPDGLRSPSASEIDAWIDSNRYSLPQDLISLPHRQLHDRILSLLPPPPPPPHNQVAQADQIVEHPYRFQRTELWKPVYSWLEPMDTAEIIQPEEINGWLLANPEVKEKLCSKHPRYHLIHYIQKVHMKMLKKRGKLPKGMHLSTVKASAKALRGDMAMREVSFSSRLSGHGLEDKKLMLSKKKEAFIRYELLTDLENALLSYRSKHKVAVNLMDSRSPSLPEQRSENITDHCSVDVGEKDGPTRIASGGTSHSQGLVNVHVTNQEQPMSLLDIQCGHKRKREPVTVFSAWSHCEALPEASQTDQTSSSLCEEAAGSQNVLNHNTHSSTMKRACFQKNIVMSLLGREDGISWPLACSYGRYAGRNRERWIPFLEGWRSVGRQFEGPGVWFSRQSYFSWVPTWCAYSSSSAVVQPSGRQGVQKVLDVRFHPEGLPQLVCSSNEAPNELLLYNLLSGRATQLVGHNCQIQAVEYAVRGASIVSCGSNLLKVWDCITGSCLFTLGSIGEDRALVGHTRKINAMTVNRWQSCLVVTGGGGGDGKLLLWNALRGELAADLNSSLRVTGDVYPSIDAMEFCNENLLACANDYEYDAPAIVQLWDIESPQSCLSFSANDSHINSLKVSPDCNTILTGAGDGTVGLFDVRTCSSINYLSVGSCYEVTSVSFSNCGTYFSASSTSNSTMIWDTRLMPMNQGKMPLQNSDRSTNERFLKPLHCLSHGKQMPTAEHAGQLPGHVDEGDQGVNDARWFEREPVLVTVSGDGSIAMWDVTLGQPCVRHLISHTRCTNTVAVAPNDEYLCTVGDDQKIVLYQNKRGRTQLNWRLSHPLTGRD